MRDRLDGIGKPEPINENLSGFGQDELMMQID